MKAFDSLYKLPCHDLKGLPIIVTMLFGIVMLVRDSQPLKAPTPIVVTLFGILILVSELHNQKALFPITFTPFLIEYLPLKLSGTLSNLFQSLLYSTPNSSSTAFILSSTVTSVLHTSSFGFSTPNKRKEHIDKFFLALANRNIDRRVFVSSSANKPCSFSSQDNQRLRRGDGQTLRTRRAETD